MEITTQHKRDALAFLTDWDKWADKVAGLPSNCDDLPVEGVEGVYYNKHGLCAASRGWVVSRPSRHWRVQEYLQFAFGGEGFPFGEDANYGPESGANCKARRDWVKARISQLHAELAPKVYARVVALRDDLPFGAYTSGKEYEVLPASSADFMIIDDAGDPMGCWWHDDPDCLFERVIR